MSGVVISVVTIVLNDRAGLARTRRSVFEQTHQQWEWIVVDGGSTDGTLADLQGLSDPRVRWSSQRDDGIYDAMNRGARAAHGDLVVFLNAGDAFADADVLEAVVADRVQCGWLWACGVTMSVDDAGNAVDVKHAIPFSQRALELGYRAVPHPSTFYSRSLLEQLGGFDESVGLVADQELAVRAARIAPPRLLPRVLAIFDVGGVSSQQPPDAFVWQSRRLRRRDGRFTAGSSIVDFTVSALLAGERRMRHRLASRWRGRGDLDAQ